MAELKKKPLFNPAGDTEVRLRRIVGGNTTNLNDFNNMKYSWVSDWYRQSEYCPEIQEMIKSYRMLAVPVPEACDNP